MPEKSSVPIKVPFFTSINQLDTNQIPLKIQNLPRCTCAASRLDRLSEDEVDDFCQFRDWLRLRLPNNVDPNKNTLSIGNDINPDNLHTEITIILHHQMKRHIVEEFIMIEQPGIATFFLGGNGLHIITTDPQSGETNDMIRRGSDAKTIIDNLKQNLTASI